MSNPPPSAAESAEMAYAELATLWSKLPAAWTTGKLADLHAGSRAAVIQLLTAERGLAELMHLFFERGLGRWFVQAPQG